jgi:hypothetical protein
MVGIHTGTEAWGLLAVDLVQLPILLRRLGVSNAVYWHFFSWMKVVRGAVALSLV